MSKSVIGLFDDFAQAQSAVQYLENSGFARDDISIVAGNQSGQFDQYANTAHSETAGDATANAAGAGATTGAVVGGGLGLLTGLGLLAIPGFGPIAAAGWLISTITGAGIGAAAGGLLGALTHLGVPHEEAELYQEGVRRGSTLVAVRAEANMAERAGEILSSHGAVNIDERADEYRSTISSGAAETAAYNPAGNAAGSYNTPRMVNGQEITNPVVQDQVMGGNSGAQRSAVRAYDRPLTGETLTPANTDPVTGAEHVSRGSGYDVSPTTGQRDTRGAVERAEDAMTGDRVDDKTGNIVR